VPHNEINDYYSLIDVFVCPRLHMRLTDLVTPLKPLESMAMGKAILASDVGGHRELIENNRTGQLYAPENTDDFVQQAVRLGSDPALRQRLGEAGRGFVTSKRSWDNLARHYVRIYQELLVTHRKNAAAPAVDCDSIT
jgi:glycosyltransferase involved in cell wall biosynthesis